MGKGSSSESPARAYLHSHSSLISLWIVRRSPEQPSAPARPNAALGSWLRDLCRLHALHATEMPAAGRATAPTGPAAAAAAAADGAAADSRQLTMPPLRQGTMHLCVEYPGYVADEQRVLETLGGLHGIARQLQVRGRCGGACICSAALLLLQGNPGRL